MCNLVAIPIDVGICERSGPFGMKHVNGDADLDSQTFSKIALKELCIRTKSFSKFIE